MHTIPNWAPLEEITPLPKLNPWAKKHGLAHQFCFLYSGVLGLKHNPGLLLKLALHWKDCDEVSIVVVSEGLGADWLKEQCQALGLNNLRILNFQPYDCFPEVLASADVLVAILEADAGVYSVPSKVLTYLCARRPLLVSIPADNKAARIVTQNNAGLVADPYSSDEFAKASEVLFSDRDLREQFARNGLAYAQNHFDIERIADAFEELICSVA
jgi:glycosyltransferase involved in cell wall biosynthesis